MYGCDLISQKQASGKDSGASNSTQNKRAACDRCRGQKLRCLVDHGDPLNAGKCKRCIAAGTTCSFGLSKRAGRPPNPNAKSTAERRRRMKDCQEEESADTEVEASQCSTAEDTGERAEARLDQNSNDSQLEISNMGHGRWQGGPAIESDQMINTLSTDPSPFEILQHHDHLAFSSTMSPSTASPTWTGERFNMLGKPATVIMDNFAPGPAWSFASASQAGNLNLTFPSDEAFGHLDGVSPHDLLSAQPNHEQLPFSNPCFMSKESSIGGALSLADSTMTGTDETTVNGDPASDPNDLQGQISSKLDSIDDSQHHASSNRPWQQRVQELSELSISLYSQVMAADSDLARVDGSPDPIIHLTGEVLKSSSAFMSLLKSFFQPHSGPGKTVVVEPSNEPVSESSSSDFTLSPQEGSASEDYWSASSTTSKLNDDSTPLAADMATILQLLTCYIHIINLHGRLYSRTLEHLNTARCRKVHPPVVFPGLQLGGVPLDRFGTFQVKFVLQAITHVLGEIETALGLPEGYRVSKKVSMSRGVLEASVSTQFVEMMMRENSRMGLGLGPDGIAVIRENLKSLKEHVRGSINI